MKTGISILIILVLLPYVAVVFRTGNMKGLEEETRKPGVEEYVMGILPGQISLRYQEEALKAQAVIIRTNLLYKSMAFYGAETAKAAAEEIKEEDLEEMGFVYYSPEKRAELWGYDQLEHYEARIRKAAEDTEGEILAIDGRPLDLPYHAVSAGRTRSGQVLGEAYSYLKETDCPGDVKAADYLKIQTFSQEEMPEVPEILARDDSGYVTEVVLGEERMAGEEFRSRYQLNSSDFTAEAVERGVRITTKGLGHGLGLSLYEANRKALDGASYLEILMCFYKNVECISFY